MTDDMKTVLAEYTKKLLVALEQGAGFVGDQIPLIVQEKLAYDFWYAIFWVIIPAIVAVAVWLGWYKLNQKYEWEEDCCVPTFFIACILNLAAFITLCVNGATALKIYLAPRLYIIEWLRSMI